MYSNRESLGGYLLSADACREARDQDNFMSLLKDQSLLKALTDEPVLANEIADHAANFSISFSLFDEIASVCLDG
jgi:hypothetical protein